VRFAAAYAGPVAPQRRAPGNNERLEFLGDAVLGYVISEDLYHRFPKPTRARLSRLRVSLVKGSALADVARELDLGAQCAWAAG
jgi:ribonuclease-3